MNSRDRLNGKLIIALGRTYRNAHRKSSELFREKGLTLAQFTVLELLYNRGEQTVQSIIDKVLSSSGNITVVVRNLEQMGLVGRRDNPEDGRSYLIGITPKGKALIKYSAGSSYHKRITLEFSNRPISSLQDSNITATPITNNKFRNIHALTIASTIPY